MGVSELEEFKKNPEYKAFEWLKQFTVPACERIESQTDMHLGEQAMVTLEETLFVRVALFVKDAIGMECVANADKEFNIPSIAYSLIPREKKCEIAEFTYENLMKLDNKAIFNHNPALEEIITTVVEQYVAAMLEMFERIDRHRTDIEQAFLAGNEITIISDISTAGADTHNDGRTTARIETNAGTFMYKPHDMRIDIFVNGLCEQYFSDVVKVPSALSFTDNAGFHYGFAEYLANTPASTMQQASKYYYNLGGFTALALMLGSDDLHIENMLSVGDMPAVVDLEMMMTPLKLNNTPKNYKLFNFYESIYGTKMFPTLLAKIEQCSPLISTSEKNQSIPIVNGKKITVYRFLTQYYDGFTDIYRRIIHNKDSIREYVMHTEDFAVRVLARPTNVYMKMLFKICFEALSSGVSIQDEKVDTVISGFLRGSSEEEEQGFVLSERNQLKRLNIPYFYVGAISGTPCAEGHCVAGIEYFGSPIDDVLCRLSQFNNEGLEYNLQLIKYLLTELIDSNTCDAPENIVQVHNYSSEELYLSIRERTVKFPNGKLLWMSNHNGLGTEILRHGLYYGISGIALTEAALASVIDDIKLKNILLTSIDDYYEEICNFLEICQKMHILKSPYVYSGRSNGLAGIVDALVRISHYLNDYKYIQLAKKFIVLIEKYNWDDPLVMKDISMKNGIAGCLYVLCKYREELDISDDIIRKLAKFLANQQKFEVDDGKFLWSTIGKKRAISGLDIGMGGIGYPLLMAGNILNDQRLKDAAQDAINYEKSSYNESCGWGNMAESTVMPQAAGSYHSGNPGMGMLWMRMGEDELANKAIDAVLKSETLFSDRLENGNLAVIDFLIEAGTHYGRPELIEQAKKKYDEIAARNRHYCREDMYQSFNPTLFAGEFGLQYIKLRSEFPDKIHTVLL